MYLREKLIRILKIKNVILTILGIFNIAQSAIVMISLISHYSDQLETVLEARATPESLVATVIGLIFLIEACVSRRMIGDASFYSGYFEGDLDGYVKYGDLADVMGKSESKVRRQLRFFRRLYMKGFELGTVDNVEQVVLDSKKCLCECRNCGAPVEKRIYFTGVCSYCGSSDLFARVLTDNRFYSIKNNVSEGVKKPGFYSAKYLQLKKAVFLICLWLGLSVVVISVIGGISNIADYNDQEYLTEVLMSGKSYSSFKLIKGEIMDTIITFAVFAAAFIPVVCNSIIKIRYIFTTENCSKYFAYCGAPYVSAAKFTVLCNGKKRKNSMSMVRGALRRRYLRNCTLDKHNGTLRVALAKKVVKDECPSCGAPIVGAVDENYECRYCGNMIMNVVCKK